MCPTRTIVCLAAACLLAGCGIRAADSEPTSRYRTIRTDPLRNTDAAVEANRRGLELLNEGKLEAAEDAFTKALTLDVQYGPAHNNLGKVYFRQANWYKAAWEFENARKLMPRHPAPRNNLGLVLERAGELDQAVDSYREAVGLAPDNIQYVANLARALVRRGDRTGETRDYLERILAEDDRTQWLIWARQQLSRFPGAGQ